MQRKGNGAAMVTSYRSALNEIQAHIDAQTQPLAEFSLSEVGRSARDWLLAPEQADLLVRTLDEVIDQMVYGFAQRAVARHRSGKILSHGLVRDLEDWKAEVRQRVRVIQGWKELIQPGHRYLRGSHKDLLDMTGTDFQAAAINRRLRAKVENDIASLWEQLGAELGTRRARDRYPTHEDLAARTLELQGIQRPPEPPDDPGSALVASRN